MYESYQFVEEESVVAALLNEVSSELLETTAAAEHSSAIAAQQEHRNNIELQAIRGMLLCIFSSGSRDICVEVAEKTVVRRMALAHVIMTMITKYEKVITAHYARGIAHRLLANKLLLLVEEIERRVDAPKQVRGCTYAVLIIHRTLVSV